ncbi:MAG: hypothetical protein KF696_14830 [Planctomycetes bacterium]|nr:hypothetical protein [Planctomycetota bacterium]MCW8137107.1 hypothetical protein [Planctomycetota bacterium]
MKRAAFACMLLIALALAPLAWINAGAPRHQPQPVWLSGTTINSGEWTWAEAKKGDVKGKVTFSAKRPNQPMVVYLLKIDERGSTTTQGKHDVPARLSVSQKGARFDPGFAVLTCGQEVVFENDEDKEISHNVYFLGDIELDLGIFDKGESASHKFEKYGDVSVHCSIHKRMDARFFVAPTPAHAVLDGNSDDFEIKGVPAGRYKLLTWQRQKRFKDADQVIEISEGKTTSVNVEMSR